MCTPVTRPRAHAPNKTRENPLVRIPAVTVSVPLNSRKDKNITIFSTDGWSSRMEMKCSVTVMSRPLAQWCREGGKAIPTVFLIGRRPGMFTHCPCAVPSGADIMSNDTKPWAQEESLWNEKYRSVQLVGYETTARKPFHQSAWCLSLEKWL